MRILNLIAKIYTHVIYYKFMCVKWKQSFLFLIDHGQIVRKFECNITSLNFGNLGNNLLIHMTTWDIFSYMIRIIFCWTLVWIWSLSLNVVINTCSLVASKHIWWPWPKKPIFNLNGMGTTHNCLIKFLQHSKIIRMSQWSIYVMLT